jgi:hypothetical protein
MIEFPVSQEWRGCAWRRVSVASSRRCVVAFAACVQEEKMTVEENKKLVLQHYEDFLHRRDADAVRRQLTADFVDHELPPGTP